MLFLSLVATMALQYCQVSYGSASPTDASVPTIIISTISTAVASASADLSSALPSQVAIPPKQAWCPSDIFCAGQLLQTVSEAQLYPDDKTFVDKPTVKAVQAVLADFNNISTYATFGQVEQFVVTDFAGEGLELEALAPANFNPNPPFLSNVTDPLYNAFVKIVHGFWIQLIRGTNSSSLCSGATCESSLIPLNHTFVVPGGRFREQYYWDSFWIIEGLLESQLFDIANATLQNFMDELELYGFIPNGGRIYYLNRSQPPLFIQMVSLYVTVSGDRSILKRALPLAEKELKWWDNKRSISVTSPFSNTSYKMYHYAATNSAPRPESYLADYMTANGPNRGDTLNETQRSALYAELASGAETGWDYTVRWFKNTSKSSNYDLRDLNVRQTVPVDLNSIIYNDHILLAGLYGPANAFARSRHEAAAQKIRAGILDLFWDSNKLAFYDFNLATKARNNIFSVAQYYPVWSGIIPEEILSNSTSAFGFFASINMVMHRYNGTIPSTFIDSGLQWDAPNAWPPHQYIALQALRALPSNITNTSPPIPAAGQSTFELIPTGQLGLNETQLPGQPVRGGRNATGTGSLADINTLNGTVINGGNATTHEGWATTLQRELANRYLASTLCSWHATGGSIPGLLPRLSDKELNVTLSVNTTGEMFEKFSTLEIDSAGRGGEYTVQAGFGWTNGVFLWIASNYGPILVAPTCPDILSSLKSNVGSTSKNRAFARVDVSFVKRGILVSLGLLMIFLQKPI